MTKVLLVDVDSTIPNIALMKVSSYHKHLGDDVTLIKCGINLYRRDNSRDQIVDANGYDKVYASAIFSNTIERVKIINAMNIDIGGSGVSLSKTLPDEINCCDPDYSIYPDNDTSYGFLSRGCIRNCSFCIVREKEGLLKQVAIPSDIIRHKKVKFLDNNFLALKNHKELLKELIELHGVKIQFNQGLDIRLVDDENARLLSQLNYLGEYIFAFDDLSLLPVIETKMSILKKYIARDWGIKLFIYCHPRMNIPNDVFKRIMWCRKHKVLPYFMRDIECWASDNRRTYNDFSAWCNQPGIFKTHTYKRFCEKRRPQKNRIDVFPNWFKPESDIDDTTWELS